MQQASVQYDVIVVGAGPNGLVLLHELQKAGLKVLAIEAGRICENIRALPPDFEFASENFSAIGFQRPKIYDHRPSARDIVSCFEYLVESEQLCVLERHKLIGVGGNDGNFLLGCQRPDGTTQKLRTRKIVLATGMYHNPSGDLLPGESDSPVQRYMPKTTPRGKRILVIGGGNAAAVTILRTAQHNEVVWSFRRKDPTTKLFSLWKEDVRAVIRNAPHLRTIPESQVTAFANNSAHIVSVSSEEKVDFDICYRLVGYRPDKRLLKKECQLQMVGAFPDHDPQTCMSHRPGIYIFGSILHRAVVQGKFKQVFMLDSKTLAPVVSNHIRSSLSD